MCEYCQHIYTGNDCIDLLEIPIVFGIGSAFKEKECYPNAIYIGIEDEKLVVESCIAGGDIERAAELPIKYCPICGQDLSYLKENTKSGL